MQDLWRKGDILDGEYEVESVLGRGGMGRVYALRRIFDGKLYAGKVLRNCLADNELSQRLFLRELRLWWDLPDHPNLVSCRFFRTLEGRLVIFSELVSGGSLKKKLSDGFEGGGIQVLDLAVQMAVGLQAAHDCRLVHGDVKPGNMLVTPDGTAKVTDFGLSRIMAEFDRQGLLPEDDDSTGGFSSRTRGLTLKYCSPEQAEGGKVDFRTDIWSWGLTVLACFAGDDPVQIGVAAGAVLARYRCGDIQPRLAIPDGLYCVLERCFRNDPEERFANMIDACPSLIDLWERAMGAPYTRVLRRVDTSINREKGKYQRITSDGVKWQVPSQFLERALLLAGRDLSEMKELLPHESGSQKARALVDLEVLEVSRRVAETVYPLENAEVLALLADIHNDEADLYRTLGDLAATGNALRSIIKYLEILKIQHHREDWSYALANAYTNLALVVSGQGNVAEALRMHEKSVQIHEKLAEVEPDNDQQAKNLARAMMNCGNALIHLKRYPEGLEAYKRVMGIMEGLLEKRNVPVQYPLAMITMNVGLILWQMEDSTTSRKYFLQAVVLLERMAQTDDSVQIIMGLQMARRHFSLCLMYRGCYREAILQLDAGEKLVRSLQVRDDHTEIRIAMGVILLRKAWNFILLRDLESGTDSLNRAVAIFQDLIDRDGCSHVLMNLLDCAICDVELGLIQGEYAQARQRLVAAWRLLRKLEFDDESRLQLWMLSADIDIALACFEKAMRKNRRVELYCERHPAGSFQHSRMTRISNYLQRIQCFQGMDRHEEALRVFQSIRKKVCRMWLRTRSGAVRRRLLDVKRGLIHD